MFVASTVCEDLLYPLDTGIIKFKFKADTKTSNPYIFATSLSYQSHTNPDQIAPRLRHGQVENTSLTGFVGSTETDTQISQSNKDAY